jgi:hypothetical protein
LELLTLTDTWEKTMHHHKAVLLYLISCSKLTEPTAGATDQSKWQDVSAIWNNPKGRQTLPPSGTGRNGWLAALIWLAAGLFSAGLAEAASCTVPGANPPCPPALNKPLMCVGPNCSANNLMQTTKPVHCGDQDYADMRKVLWALNGGDPSRPEEKWDANLADVCSFGSNRIRVFGALPDPANPGGPCLRRSVKWIVPHDVSDLRIRAYGGAGGDYRPNTGAHAGPDQWVMGGVGGFAEFDGVDRTTNQPFANLAIQPGDVLEVFVGCKGADTVDADKSGTSSGGYGGGSSAVRLIQHNGQPPLDSPIDLVIAGGGGGAGRDGVGGSPGGYGGNGGWASGFYGFAGSTPAGGGSGGGKGSPGVGGNSCGTKNAGEYFDGVHPGSGAGGSVPTADKPGAWGLNQGGYGGWAAFPGGGGGGGFGGGGQGSTGGGGSGCKTFGAGGGGGGSYSYGTSSAQADTRQGSGSNQDGYVVVTWTPDVLGGKHCYYNCRAVWTGCAWEANSAAGSNWLYRMPDGASNIRVAAFGAPGGGAMDSKGGFINGGAGGYAGASAKGTSGLYNNSFAVAVGCPGEFGNTNGKQGGGGGSSAVILSQDGRPIPGESVNANIVIVLAGGGGGAGKATSGGGAGGTIGENGGPNISNIGPGKTPAGVNSGKGGNEKGGAGGEWRGEDGQPGFGGNGGAGQGTAGGRGVDGPASNGWGGNGDVVRFANGGGGGGGGYGGGGGGGGDHAMGPIWVLDSSGGGGGASYAGNTANPVAPPDPGSPMNAIFFKSFEFALGQIPVVGKGLAGGVELTRQIGDYLSKGNTLPSGVANLAGDLNRNSLATGMVIMQWSCSRSTGSLYTCAYRPNLFDISRRHWKKPKSKRTHSQDVKPSPRAKF